MTNSLCNDKLFKKCVKKTANLKLNIYTNWEIGATIKANLEWSLVWWNVLSHWTELQRMSSAFHHVHRADKTNWFTFYFGKWWFLLNFKSNLSSLQHATCLLNHAPISTLNLYIWGLAHWRIESSVLPTHSNGHNLVICENETFVFV